MTGRALLALVVLGGCAHTLAYVEPPPNEPHAVLKVRVSYHAAPGPALRESLTLGGHAISTPPVGSLQDRSFTRAIRVRPESQHLRIRSSFYHTETRQERVPYTEYERYPCGTTYTPSYSSGGYGSGGGSSTTQYCSRPVQKWRNEIRTVSVEDGACMQEGSLRPTVGVEYMLQFDFYGNGQCSLRCFRQTPSPTGGFDLVPCATPGGGTAASSAETTEAQP